MEKHFRLIETLRFQILLEKTIQYPEGEDEFYSREPVYNLTVRSYYDSESDEGTFRLSSTVSFDDEEDRDKYFDSMSDDEAEQLMLLQVQQAS